MHHQKKEKRCPLNYDVSSIVQFALIVQNEKKNVHFRIDEQWCLKTQEGTTLETSTPCFSQ